MMASMSERRPLAWVPWAFVGAFGVVIAVNAVLIVFATRTFSGLVVEKPYQKGIEYERTLRQEEVQAALGWSTTTAFRPQTGEVAVRYLDAAGRPMADLQVSAEIKSPLRPEAAVDLALGYKGDGWYAARAGLGPPGQREAEVTAIGGGGARHVIRFRFMAP